MFHLSIVLWFHSFAMPFSLAFLFSFRIPGFCFTLHSHSHCLCHYHFQIPNFHFHFLKNNLNRMIRNQSIASVSHFIFSWIMCLRNFFAYFPKQKNNWMQCFLPQILYFDSNFETIYFLKKNIFIQVVNTRMRWMEIDSSDSIMWKKVVKHDCAWHLIMQTYKRHTELMTLISYYWILFYFPLSSYNVSYV